MRNQRPILLLLAALALVLGACQSGSPESTGTASANASGSAAGEPTATQNAALEEAKGRTWRVGITGEGTQTAGDFSGFQLNKLNRVLAMKEMIADGWKIEVSFLNQSEAPVQQLLAGNLEIATSSVTPVLTAIKAGANLKVFGAAAAAQYVMLTTSDINGPEDLNGKRIGLHANVSTTTLLTKVFLIGHPDVKPVYVIVPGSANRVLALLAGQLDASALQFGDDTTVLEKAPDKFHVIYSFAKENPELLDEVWEYNADAFDDATRAFAGELLLRTMKWSKWIYEHQDETKQVAEAMDVATVSGLDRFIANNVWPRDEQPLTEVSAQKTLDASADSGLIECPCPSAADVIDLSIWEGVKADFK